MHRVMIEKSSYDTCQAAIDKAFEMFPQSLEGKKVLIKPNVLRGSKPDEHIVTHATVLKAVIRKVESFSPESIVVGDNPGVYDYGDNEKAFRETGLMDAAGPYYKNIGNDMQAVPFNPAYLNPLRVSTDVMEADVVISLPKFKTHGLTVLSGGIKNSYGCIPGAQKAKLHRLAGSPERFHDLVVDVFAIRVPDLFIMDAVVGMEGNGPASPDLRDIGVILAADNAVALDATVARMMGVDPHLLKFLRKAKKEGLGDFESDQIEIKGTLAVIDQFKLPPLSGTVLLKNKTVQEFMDQKISATPHVDTEKCTSCGECVSHCPVEALEMRDDTPEADAEVCIACFCCQEICPEKAMTLY